MTRSSGSEKAKTSTQAALVSNKLMLGSEVQNLKCHREHTEISENRQRADRKTNYRGSSYRCTEGTLD